ncbi:SufS family cysteine desulfurase [Patescibacteria group bacterium]|nr:SufS family cysteine desulfurase [Patescibacteria group bacterium]
MFDAIQVRQDFPILSRLVHGQPLVYLDNAATSQKPNQVIDAISEYYRQHNANVHRGVHLLGDESTRLFHQSRRTIAAFFGAHPEELIIVRNTTEALNQVVYSWADQHLAEGQVILTTELEHHSNLVPWQQLALRKNMRLLHVPVLSDGQLDFLAFDKLLEDNEIALFVCSHVSNTLGTRNPIQQLSEQLKRTYPDAKVVIDGAQAAPHIPVDFEQLPVDFYAVSAHKMLGPMGIGGLLVKRELLAEFSPFLFGGGMINEVRLHEASWADDIEDRFTAGTPDVAGLVGWAAACEYLTQLGMKSVEEYDQVLVRATVEKLVQLPEVELVGITQDRELHKRVGAVSFLYKGVHAHDVGQILDSEGVAVRTGHHCTMPLHRKFGWPATVRVSFQVYNTLEEVDKLVAALDKVKQVFRL